MKLSQVFDVLNEQFGFDEDFDYIEEAYSPGKKIGFDVQLVKGKQIHIQHTENKMGYIFSSVDDIDKKTFNEKLKLDFSEGLVNLIKKKIIEMKQKFPGKLREIDGMDDIIVLFLPNNKAKVIIANQGEQEKVRQFDMNVAKTILFDVQYNYGEKKVFLKRKNIKTKEFVTASFNYDIGLTTINETEFNTKLKLNLKQKDVNLLFKQIELLLKKYPKKGISLTNLPDIKYVLFKNGQIKVAIVNQTEKEKPLSTH